jgi:creatinine amidohydrolase/Fe(II)-dependent formamide hydrolase-like protein
MVENIVIQRINRTTKGVAVAVGIESPIQKEEGDESFDWHAGKHETSMMLFLKPEPARMDRTEKPVLHFTPAMKKIEELAKTHPELNSVYGTYFATLAETGEGGGASHELSSNGIWSLYDPKTATKELGMQEANRMIDSIVKFIESWKLVK